MTEKRFRGNFQREMLVSVKDTQKDCNVNILQIIEIANVLVDENEQLKSDYDTLKIQDDARKQYQKELMKENEELKKEVKQLKNKINTYHEGNKTLHQTLQKYWEDRYNE